ncbi:killer cell lectin-like receptor subfamily F member 2 isoform X4 [Pelodiscus sinensis]|uniref:killer cell lectin-like receptor subfamily F member 2 isoform X4 n=1 Tax=Pelodiscus sinensis TaxID=13735 RepID=UPI003F6C657E
MDTNIRNSKLLFQASCHLDSLLGNSSSAASFTRSKRRKTAKHCTACGEEEDQRLRVVSCFHPSAEALLSGNSATTELQDALIRPGPRRSPGWPQIALGAGNLLLAVAVLMLALCGGAGCKLCPTDWRLRGDKCYWVGTGIKPWDESRSDCAARGSQLLVIRDQEELAALQNLTQASKLMWVGLSLLPPRKAWTWLDGSRLDPTLLPVSGPAEGSSCGAVKGTRLHSDTCSSVFQWICQRDAIPL